MKNIQDFKPLYECFNGKSYISFLISADNEIIRYQAEMLSENRIDFLLPFTIQRFNDGWKLYYDITSKVPLEKVLERKSLNHDEFASFIKQIGKLSAKLKDYLLDISSVIFERSYIYCDPGDLSLYFIYFPVKDISFDSDMIKNFLQGLIFQDIRLQDDSSGSLLKRILDVLKSETFSTDMLVKCVSPVYPDTGSVILERSKDFNDTDETYMRFPGTRTDIQFPLKQKEFSQKPVTDKSQNMIHGMKNKKGDNTAGLKYPLKSYLIAGSANMLLIGLLVFIMLSGKNSGDPAGTVTGLFLIGFAVNYYIFSQLFRENKTTGKKETANRSERPFTGFIAGSAGAKGVITPKQKTVYLNPAVNRDFDENSESTGLLTRADNYMAGFINLQPVPGKITERSRKFAVHDRTVVLGNASGNVPYFQSHSCPSERIYFTKDSMLLGRLPDSVDYTIQNMAVGKIHAEIIKKEDGYYIMDLNSVNGTFVNGERITCSTEVKLKNGDIVTLANESYTFVI